MRTPRIALLSRRVRWYAVYGALARLLLLWVVFVVVITPRIPVPSTREPHRMVLKIAWCVAIAGIVLGATRALAEQRRSIRRHYMISTVACLTALAVGLVGYPVRQPPPIPAAAAKGLSPPSASPTPPRS